MSRVGNALRMLIGGTTVEPIVFCLFFAFSMAQLSEHAVLYQSICWQNFQRDPTVDCRRLSENHVAEDKVQKIASKISMLVALCISFPAAIASVFLGAWSDRNGRKICIMLALAGLIVRSIIWIVLDNFPQMNVGWLLGFSFMVGGTGYYNLVMTMSLAYLSDAVTDHSQLTFRMMVVLMSKSLADVIGSFALGSLLLVVEKSTALVLAQTVCTLGFFYALIRLYQLPPDEMKTLSKAKQAKKEELESPQQKVTIPPPESGGGCLQEIRDVADNVATSYKEVWQTLTGKRHYHKRAYLWLCNIVFYFYMMADFSLLNGPVTSLYVFHRPFNWSPSQLGTFKGVLSVCSLIGIIIGAVLKRRFRWSDSALMLLGLVSGCIQMFVMGFSKTDWMLYVAAIIGVFNALLLPSLKAFMVSLVKQDEVGKALATNGIAADIAQLSGVAAFSSIYAVTVQNFAGSVFIISGITMAICAGATGWACWDTKRQEKRRLQLTTISANADVCQSTNL